MSGAETIAKAIQEDERRARRDSYRRAGGSQRRALRTFYTSADKKDRREAHRDLLNLAIEELRDPAGFEAWCETLDLNPQLTACNAALVALQTPGEVVGITRSWAKLGARIAQGETAAGRLTAPGFWPLAYFTAAQAGCPELSDVAIPPAPAGVHDRLRASLVHELDARPRKEWRLALDAVAAEYRGARGNVEWIGG